MHRLSPSRSTQRTPAPPAEVDAVVVGGGHAGIEAVWALATLGARVALVTFDARALGRMACNPSVGGLAKGQLAREIDALGGLMGRLTDRAGIHFRMLNRRKGPAVHAPRAQIDKPRYAHEALGRLQALTSLTIIEAEATQLLWESARGQGRRITGLRLRPFSYASVARGAAHGSRSEVPPADPPPGVCRLGATHDLGARVVVLATGTFLDARLFTGLDPRCGGRRGEPPASELSQSLREIGLRLGRLKTGTPPRLDRATIDFRHLEPQPGDEPPPRFSFFEPTVVKNRVLCHLTRTTERTHVIVRGALDRSPLYGGLIAGVGPRYCPSIEDKVVRFPERTSHQVFLEPEGLASDEVYPNGISTSLPLDVQVAYVHTIPGLEEARIVHPGYAVEYDFLWTSQLDAGLHVRACAGLFAAGQINGTSGYEEAAAQGLVAGLNAHAYLNGDPPRRLARSDAYIGVLIDDLITKVPQEPYRMFTSQSEYRLRLRQDNADRRLSRWGHAWGLLSRGELRQVTQREAEIRGQHERLRARRLDRELWGRAALVTREAPNTAPLAGDEPEALLRRTDIGQNLDRLLRRPGLDLAALESIGVPVGLDASQRATLEADIKYAGYLERLEREISERKAWDAARIPPALLDEPPAALSREARERLREHRPETLGQASRIPGITPCDVSLLAVRIAAGRRRKHAAAAERGYVGPRLEP